ncbi:leucine-rich repeat extensin-like protein 5 [Salvia splendens]|uniref:leucine-rich repeat extensin-like protein 5 n=1 Tax=Salvia splendens TaxID=180675 RepID=UPI001C262A23|nr:leucine-rich repeat extensin-like protein 5 [Salvia splendens]
MLIKEIPTTPSSPRTGADGGNRETSSRVRQENPNPSTPTTAPPLTSTVTPHPEVDEETLRHLDKILRSIPRELDDAAAYAELKSRPGISRPKAKASSSKTKIFPSSPTSPPSSTVQPSPPSPPKATSPVQTLPLSPLPSPPISPSPTINLPSSPTSPPPSPVQPSPSSPTQPMQCSESTSDGEGLREDYGQPFTMPSPTRSGAPTSVHESQGGNNDE